MKKLVWEEQLDVIVDHNPSNNYDGEEVKEIAVALLCTQSKPEDWPSMSEVVHTYVGRRRIGRDVGGVATG